MEMPKFYIGPMSKNIVDAIVEFCEETNNTIGLIPSRRQIEYDGGYVNNWTTEEFVSYVKSKTNKIIIERDHSGPGQGQIQDDGYTSLSYDCLAGIDIIHIDPWKEYSSYDDGLNWTIKMIKHCYSKNPKILFEIGTEEAIRKFDDGELIDLMFDLQKELNFKILENIKYLVIQSGTALKGNNQIGQYNKERLNQMVNVAKSFNLLTKEHNGDYIPTSTIKEKFDLGLDAINIAPEFGLIETETYMKNIQKEWRFSLIELFWEICFKSNKWVKWVDENFDPYKQKYDLIRICGHYVLSYPEFIDKIKLQFPNIDNEIKQNVKNKLNELYG